MISYAHITIKEIVLFLIIINTRNYISFSTKTTCRNDLYNVNAGFQWIIGHLSRPMVEHSPYMRPRKENVSVVDRQPVDNWSVCPCQAHTITACSECAR